MIYFLPVVPVRCLFSRFFIPLLFVFVLDFPFRLYFLFLLEAVDTPIWVSPRFHLFMKSCMFDETLAKLSWNLYNNVFFEAERHDL